MANKLKDIFSDDMFNIDGKMRFESKDAYRKFLTAMEMVQNEGRVVPVEGVTSITTEIRNHNGKYPLDESTNITDLVIGPAVEPVDLDVFVDGELKKIQLRRFQITDAVVLETDPNAVVYFKFNFPDNGYHKHTVQYKIQFAHAKTIDDVIKDFLYALALLDRIYENERLCPEDEDNQILIGLKQRLRFSIDTYKRIKKVEQVLDLYFDPKYLNDFSEENQQDVEELYILLCQKAAIRLNAKLTTTDNTNVTIPPEKMDLAIGKAVKLAFIGTIEYKLFNHLITLHSSNLVSDAIIREIREHEGKTQVLYGDLDSKPMYISYRAFLTEEEARQEKDALFEHEDMYVNAKTIRQHIEGYLSE